MVRTIKLGDPSETPPDRTELDEPRSLTVNGDECRVVFVVLTANSDMVFAVPVSREKFFADTDAAVMQIEQHEEKDVTLIIFDQAELQEASDGLQVLCKEIFGE